MYTEALMNTGTRSVPGLDEEACSNVECLLNLSKRFAAM